MNTYLLVAGVLCFFLGLVHSILGELLIFQSKREKGRVVPSKKSADLKEGHLRIIWATWHLASILGWGIGGILVKVALTQDELNPAFTEMLIQAIIFSMLGGAFLVLIGTKGRHPGWIVLSLIGILLLLGN